MLPVGNTLVPVQTPLHVYQLMMHLIKETFRSFGGSDYPFKYTDDFETTGVVIDTIYNKDSQVYGVKPAIIVSRGEINTQPVILGDVGSQTINASISSQKVAVVASSVIIKVLSKNSSETDLVANELFNFLVYCRSELPHLIPIMSVSSLSLSPVVPYELDDHMFYCVSNMAYSMQYTWQHDKPLENLNFGIVYINK